MNRQPFGSPPCWWPPKLSLLVTRCTQGYRRRLVHGGQRVAEIRAEGWEHVLRPLADGCGVMLTPNHSTHYDSNALYVAADQQGLPLYIMTAWQVFHMSRWWERWLMQRVGCFSVDRESNDRQAFGQALRVLREEPFPLVVFPEGDIYHTNDRVTQFRDGAAVIAMAAARKSPRPIAIVPCAVKFWYLDDPTPSLRSSISLMERRLYLRTDDEQPLRERIHRLAEASLALKELDVLGETRGGRVRDRIGFLLNALLERLEATLNCSPPSSLAPQRVKSLRQELIGRAVADATESQRSAWRHAMEDLFLAMQLYSYPGDYLDGQPSIERIAETVDKLEEDILLVDSPPVRGARRVTIGFGEPIFAQTVAGRRKDEAAATSGLIQRRVQEILDQWNDVSAGLVAASFPSAV